jgi:starch synthase
MASMALAFPKKMNELGHEIRAFMPRFGLINERRHQLHEVIRLSGINVVINDYDQPLVIKVASVPGARIQVYFIDNEEYFKRKGSWEDDKGVFYEDNGARSLFFSKSIIETIKKLGWQPDVIHIMGWMSAPLPVYLRQFHAEDPHFAGTKLVYSLFENGFKGSLDDGLEQGMAFDGVNNSELFNQATADSLYCQALRNVDAVLEMSDLAPAAAIAAAKEAGVPVHDGRPFMEQPALLDAFYESLFA